MIRLECDKSMLKCRKWYSNPFFFLAEDSHTLYCVSPIFHTNVTPVHFCFNYQVYPSCYLFSALIKLCRYADTSTDVCDFETYDCDIF